MRGHSAEMLEDVQAGAAAKTRKVPKLPVGVQKLFERVLMGRITEHLENVGPDIHVHQYGFRPGKSKTDAINRVKCIAEGAVKQGGVSLAVSVDIVNAFNSIPWRAIVEGLTDY